MDQMEGRPVLDITVFILSYDRPQYLREMLLSVLSQSSLPQEIVILDNGSDNGTREAVQDLLGDRVKWQGADENHPSLWNFRRAFGSSDRKYFMILHDDDRLLPEFLRRTVDELERDQRLVAISTNGFGIDGEGIRTGSMMLPHSPEPLVHLRNREEAALRYSDGYVPFPNLVYRNGYPQKIAIREEFGKVWDSLFVVDLAGLGYIGILDELLFEYRYHSGQDSQEFPEGMLEGKEEFLLSETEGSPLHQGVSYNIRRRQSRRFSGLLLTSLIKRKPRRFFENASRFGYDRASVIWVIYYLMFNQLVRTVEISKLRAPHASRSGNG